VWRLALVMIYTNMHLNSVEGVAHLWHEIVLELRYRWENGYIIPG
jgi:Rab3 GTPase-activating protein catalytic subunit